MAKFECLIISSSNIFEELSSYEDVYLKGYQSARDAHTYLSMYFEFYNIKQCHFSFEDQTPNEVFFKECMQYKP